MRSIRRMRRRGWRYKSQLDTALSHGERTLKEWKKSDDLLRAEIKQRDLEIARLKDGDTEEPTWKEKYKIVERVLDEMTYTYADGVKKNKPELIVKHILKWWQVWDKEKKPEPEIIITIKPGK